MYPRQHPHVKCSFDNDSTHIFSLLQKRPDLLYVNSGMSNEKNPESTKVDCTSSNKRRDRNKQHEGENSKEQASLLKKDRNWK